MNERIRELAKSAGYSPFDSQSELLEKFAELIVREVLAVQSKLIMIDGVNGYHLDIPTKEYFGVQ